MYQSGSVASSMLIRLAAFATVFQVPPSYASIKSSTPRNSFSPPCNATAISFDSGKSSSTRSIGLSSNASATDSNPSKNNSDAFATRPLASAICSQKYPRITAVRASSIGFPDARATTATIEIHRLNSFSPSNRTARGISRTSPLRPSSGEFRYRSNLYVSEGSCLINSSTR